VKRSLVNHGHLDASTFKHHDLPQYVFTIPIVVNTIHKFIYLRANDLDNGCYHMLLFITIFNNCGQAIHAYIVWWKNIHACCNEFEQVDDNFHLYIFFCYYWIHYKLLWFIIHYLSVSYYCMICCARISCQGHITVIHSWIFCESLKSRGMMKNF
jgi:hypothetical protein